MAASDRQVIAELAAMATDYPSTGAAVQENIAEQFGLKRTAPVFLWSVEMIRAAHAQFSGLIDAGEAIERGAEAGK